MRHLISFLLRPVVSSVHKRAATVVLVGLLGAVCNAAAQPMVQSIVRQTPATSPTNADSVTWRVTFSEDVSNVNTADFRLIGTTALRSVTSVSNSVYDVTASGGNLTNLDGLVRLIFSPTQNITAMADSTMALTNTVPTGTNDDSFVVDNTVPTVDIYFPQPGTVSISEVPVAIFEFSEPVTDFEQADITVVNATLSGFQSVSANIWLVDVTPVAVGELTLSVAASAFRDLAGNLNTAVSQFSSTATPNTLPTFSATALTRSVADNAAPGTSVGEPIPAATDADDDTLSYRMLGVDARFFSFDATTRQITTRTGVDYDFETQDRYSVRIEVADGNGGTDTVTVTIQLTDGSVTPGAPTVANGIADQAATVDTAFNFTVPANTFAATGGETLSYSATRGNGTTLPSWLSFDAATRTFSGTPGAANVGILAVRVTATNPAGAAVSTEFDLTVFTQDDATAPMVLSIERQTPTDTFTNAISLTWRVTFSKDVLRVNAADFTVTGTTAPLFVSRVNAATYDVIAIGGDLDTLNAAVILGFATEQNITDTAATRNDLINTTPTERNDNSFVVDNMAPTVLIDLPSTLTSQQPLPVTIEFSEPVTGFTESDLQVINATLSDFFPASDELWVVQLTPTAVGVVSLSIGGNAVQDLAGNRNISVLQVTSTYSENINTAPSFSNQTLVRSVAENAAPGTDVGAPIPLATDADGDALSYRMVGVDASFFTFNATTRQISTRAGVDYDFEIRNSYSVQIEAADGNGGTATVTVTIQLTDVNEAPVTPVTPAAPTVLSIERQTPAVSPTNADSLSWRVTFSRDVQNVDQDDFTLTGSTATLLVSQVTASSYDVTASGGNLASLDAMVTLGFAAGQNITDTAATPNALLVTTPTGANDNRYVVDNTAPTVLIDLPGTLTSQQPLPVTIEFSEPVTGFTESDLQVVNATLSDFSPASAEQWVVQLTPTAAGVVTLSIGANAVEDLAGNRNTTELQVTSTYSGNTAPNFDVQTLTRSVAENAAPGTIVGAPIPLATDADGDALSYRMVGADASFFTFNATTRQISTQAGVDYDFETRNSYSVQIEAADGNGGTATVIVTIQLTDVNEAPVTPVTPASPTVQSIERQTPAASPTNADTLTWRVTFSGDVENVDQTDFTLTGTTATLMVSQVTASSYDVTASDGDLASLDAMVTLGFAAGQNITDTAATPNALRVATPSGANDNSYVVDNTAPTVTIDYSPGSGEVLALIQFSEPVTGFEATDITVGSGTPLDFFPIPDENRWVAHYQSVGNAVVTLSIAENVVLDLAGNGNTADSQPTFTDTPTVNTVPTFSAAALTRSVAENAVPGTSVGAPIPAATDADRDVLSYRMLGVDASSFDFNATSRQISTRADIDYDFETRNSYSVQIEAADGNGGTATVAVTIQLTDVDEPPVTPVTPVTPAVPTVANGIGDQTAAAGAAFNFTVPADTFAVTDTDGAMLSYSATQSDGAALPGWLSFNTATQTFSGTPGAANAGVLMVRVTATNPAGASASTEFDLTVTVQDAATAPTVQSIERQTPTDSPTNADTLTWRVTFSGEVQDVDQTDFTLSGTTATLEVSPVPASSSYDVTASGGNLAGLDGTVTLGFAAGQNITDTAATPNALLDTAPSGANDNSYVVDNTAPTVTIDYSPGSGEVLALIQFSEPVTGFEATDITVGSGTPLDFFPIPDENRWVAHYQSVGNAVVTLSIAENVVVDLAGNGNTAASQLASTENTVPTSRVAALKRSVAGNAAPGTGVGTEQSPVISVADAQVQEGPGATLDFVISLSRPVPPGSRPLLIPYRTGNGSAVSDLDYIGVSGRAYIRPGETSTTLSIQVLDDDHDEGSETMTLTIVAPSEGRIGRGTATGTIVNSDPMPDAWLSRFGRTASDQTAQAIRRRMEGGARESHLTVGGRRLDTLWTNAAGPALPHSLSGASPSAPASLLRAPATEGWALQTSGATGWHGFDSPAAAGGSGSLFGTALPQSPGMGTGSGRDAAAGAELTTSQPSAAGANRAWSGGGLQLPNARDLLLRSSFFYSQTADGDGGLLRRFSTWGEAATTRFNGAEGALNMDGEIATAMMGMDAEWGRWLAGLAVSHSDGAGGYNRPGSEGGTIASTLTSVNPYLHYQLNERTSFWATLGYGTGSLTLQPGNAESGHQTSLSNTMAAFGGRGVLSMFDRGRGRFELAVRSDALLTHTASDATLGLADGAGATSRVRMLLEGSGSLPAFGGTLEPRLEAGLRHDAGDAEQGAGFEIGGGLGWSRGPLSLDVGARTLLAHGDGAYEEWGYNAAVEYRPGEDGRGLRLRLGSNWGADRSGVQQLWSQQSAAGLVRSGTRPMQQRFEAEIGYGLGRNRLWYPYAAADSSAGGHALRLGLKLTSGQALEAGLEFGRREQVLGNPPEEAVLLKGRIRF